jgi:hypothetical protein
MKFKNLSPYITFNIIDNPYNNVRNVFKYKFIIPLHLNICNNERNVYSMLNQGEYVKSKNILQKDLNSIYPKIEKLFFNNAINTQTVKLEKWSLGVQYFEPASIEENSINYKVFIPERYRPVYDNTIHFTDIHIPLHIKYDRTVINDGIWSRI